MANQSTSLGFCPAPGYPTPEAMFFQLSALSGWSPAPMAASTGRLGGSRLAGAFSSAKRAATRLGHFEPRTKECK